MKIIGLDRVIPRSLRYAACKSAESTLLSVRIYSMQTLDGPLIERGVIAEIRSNGFFVFIPR